VTLAPPAETAVAEAVEVEAPEPTPTPSAVERIRPVVLWTLLAVVVVALVGWVLEVPVAQLYYNARQRHLLTEFKGPQAHATTGRPVALLQAKHIGLSVVVVQGDGPAQLRSGPGHHPGTPLPGHRGNSIIVGHRSGWAGPFRDLGKLRKGDLIFTEGHGATKTYAYKVTAIKHVAATDTRYSARTKDFRLTLVTSDGGLLGRRRLVVQAVSGDSVAGSRHRGPAIRVPQGSPLKPALGLGLGGLVVAGLAFAYLRGRYRPAALLAVLVPILLAATFALLVDLDLLLPPLR
jgi:sortase A